MLSSFRNCLGFQEQQAKTSTISPKACLFCNVTKERGFNVVYEDSNFTVFTDRSPGARLHLLCVPKIHVDNVKTLTPQDLPMLEEMKSIGTRLLTDSGFEPSMQRLGFHIPPFFSVNHLHLHILGLPCVTWFDRIKYRPSATPSRNKHKGFSHFVEIDQTMAILQAQGKVGVLPC